MSDQKKIINELRFQLGSKEVKDQHYPVQLSASDANTILAMLKEQENKRTTPRKKHIITWSRNEPFSAGELYEAICKTLRDEGELFIERTYKHEKVDYVFYVADRR